MSPEDLAALLENPSALPEGAREHLEQCPDCLHRYSLGVVDHLEGADPARVPAGAARSLAERAIRSRGGPGSSPGAARFRAVALAAAGVAVLVAALFLLTHREAGDRPAPYAPPIAAVVDATAPDGFVLPGGELAAANPPSTLRGQTSADITDVIDAAWSRYTSDPGRAAPGIEALAGLVAKGDLGLARERLDVLLTRHPDSPPALLLRAVVLARSDETEPAQALLERVARTSPAYADLAELDLGILLKQAARFPEADAVFRKLVARTKDSPLGKRAQQEMSP